MDQPAQLHSAHLAGRCAFAAAALLACALLVTFVTHTNQQAFELFMEPARYAAGLREGAAALRLIVAIDDAFIVAYVASSLFLVHALLARGLALPLGVVLGAVLAAAVLDWSENHHILSMLRRAELGLVPSLHELGVRETLSALKWLLGHASFAVLGLLLPLPARFALPLRAALVGVQVPIGVSALVVAEPSAVGALLWARYACLLSGFALLGLLMLARGRARGRPDASGSGAPA